MVDNDDNWYSILSRLDKRREKELRDYSKEIDDRKAAYDKSYHIQFEGFKFYNTWSGKNKAGIEPLDYHKWLDKELLGKARELEQEQKEEKQEKLEEQQAQEQRRIAEEEKNMDPRRIAFRERMRDMDQENQLSKEQSADRKEADKSENKKQPGEEKNIDPRRAAVQQRMKEMEEENQRSKDKDKGIDMG